MHGRCRFDSWIALCFFMLCVLVIRPLSALQGAGAPAPGHSEHPLTRSPDTLDLEGNVAPGVYTMSLHAGTPPQAFEVVVDSGSANLFLLGDSSLCDNCGQEASQSLYSPSKSSTAHLSDHDFSVRYGRGSLQAREVQDKVALGSLPAIDVTFAVTTHQAGIQNILGVAYNAVAQPQGNPLEPYFDQLVSKTGIANEFSMLLCGDNGPSKITFGSSNVELSETIDLVQESYYLIEPSKMRIKGGKSLGRFGARAVVDSGTTEILVPTEMHTEILKVLSPVAQRHGIQLSDVFYRTTADVIEQFPVLQVVVENSAGEEVELDIAPSTYFGPVGTVGYRLLLGVMNTSQVILGEAFMRNYHVVFDRANQRIGLGSNAACAAPVKVPSLPEGRLE